MSDQTIICSSRGASSDLSIACRERGEISDDLNIHIRGLIGNCGLALDAQHDMARRQDDAARRLDGTEITQLLKEELARFHKHRKDADELWYMLRNELRRLLRK